jgi:hypothetical protein
VAEPELALPKAPILGYFSNISTPTRVRILAARAVFWLALLHFAFSAFILVLTALDIWHTASDLARWRGMAGLPGVPSITLRDLYKVLWYRGNFLDVIFFAVTLAPPLLLLFFSAPVRRGSKVPTVLTLIYLVPLTLLFGLATAIFAALILVLGLGTAGHPQPILLFWLFLFPVAILVILLLKDLCSFLQWIARQPTTDKPPLPFLPTSHANTSRT